MLIFHIATAAEWQAAKASGAYTTSTLGVTLEQEGFLHCSRDSQASRVLSKYYAGVTEPLTLLTVDTVPLTKDANGGVGVADPSGVPVTAVGMHPSPRVSGGYAPTKPSPVGAYPPGHHGRGCIPTAEEECWPTTPAST